MSSMAPHTDMSWICVIYLPKSQYAIQFATLGVQNDKKGNFHFMDHTDLQRWLCFEAP